MFEYKIIKDKYLDGYSILEELNKKSKEGWEVVSVNNINENGSTKFISYLLKRKIKLNT